MGHRVITAFVATVIGAIPFNASADILMLDFNSIGAGNNGKVQTYLNNTAGVGSITVQGAVANKTYNGDGYVFKDAYGIRETLGTSEYVNGVLVPNSIDRRNLIYDTYLYNVGGEGMTHTAYGTAGDDKIVFDFETAIYAISFDWEIFPNSACQHPGEWNGCGPRRTDSNMPDFQLWAGTASQKSYDRHTGDVYGSFPIVTNANNDYPQGMGHFSTTFASGVTHVEFVDWPVRIGIDNLQVRRLPEPATLALLGLQLLALGVTRRRRK